MFKISLFAMFITSCVKHSPVAPVAPPNMYDLSTHVGELYHTTNSPCLDGLLVNLGNSCATMVEIIGEGAISILQCHQAKTKNDLWDKYTFVVVTNHNLPDYPAAAQFCIDTNAVIYSKPRP
jgi:hypothetical protein